MASHHIMPSRLALLAALLAASADGVRAAAARPLLSLRGGAVVYSQPRSRYSYGLPGETSPVMTRQRDAVEPTLDASGKVMSEAERVHVVQQFQRPAVRLAFLRRVYAIVAVQVAATAAILAMTRMHPQLLIALVRRLNIFLFWLPMVPLMMLPRAVRSGNVPSQVLLLAVFTVFESLGVGAATLAVPLQIVLRAAATTAIATGGLTAYALTTRRDFTTMGGLLSTLMLAALSLGLMHRLFGGSGLASLQAFAGVAIFCGFLVVNTQMIVGGRKRRQMRPDEYVMGAVSIYTDLIGLFLNVVASMRDES